ncbi:hypothetical protein DIPPA_14122 [Diplonema papillatum]|nr:hypothetical protein DIPPA_14122 [Diplonema papillatum]
MKFDAFPRVDFREQYDEAELARFYNTFMKVNFPIEDELDPLEVWQEVLDPQIVEKSGGFEAQPVNMHVIVIHDPASPDKKIAGGVVFEYYKLSNSCLMSYFAVSPDYRRHGLGKWLVDLARRTCEAESAKVVVTTVKDRNTATAEDWVRMTSRLQTTEANEATVKEAAGLCTAGELRWLNSCRPSSFDPCRQLSLFLAETNAERLEDAIMDPRVRHKILRRLDFVRLSFGYIQPPLSDGQAACYDLLLLKLRPPSSDACAVSSFALKLFLFDFSRSVFAASGAFLDLPWWKQMMEDLNSLPGGVDEQSTLPWSGGTKLP